MKIRVASTAWKLRKIRGDSQFFGHFHDLVSEAYDEGAQVVVLPELFSLELLPLVPKLKPSDAAKYLVQYEKALEESISRISKNSGLVVVGGSHFKAHGEEIRNVSCIGLPDGSLTYGQKNNLTAFERLDWSISRGEGLAQFAEKIGVTVGYDSLFPEAVRALAENGVQLLCVPSWTETQRGHQRVRWSCLARAIENQIFVIHSTLVGDIGREPAHSNYGSAAIIAPSVEPFPVEAILRETEVNEEGVIVADLNFEDLAECRRSSEVTNWSDRTRGVWEVRQHVHHSADPAETSD